MCSLLFHSTPLIPGRRNHVKYDPSCLFAWISPLYFSRILCAPEYERENSGYLQSGHEKGDDDENQGCEFQAMIQRRVAEMFSVHECKQRGEIPFNLEGVKFGFFWFHRALGL
jgi:hypothetical protein